MPLYMVKSRLTDEGAKTLKENPERSGKPRAL